MASPSERREHRAHDRAGLHGAAHAANAEKKGWNRARGELPDEAPLDPRDPAYDSEGDDGAGGVRLRRVVDDPMAGFKGKVLDIVREYLTSESIEEAVHALQALHEEAWLYEAVKQLVIYGLEQRERERELLSRLLAALSAGVVRADDVQRGFALVLARLPDAVLDNPGAEVVVGKFLARAVHDECLAPAFLARAAADSAPAKAALAEARVLLEGPGAGARVERVWGEAARVAHSGKRLRAQFRALLLEHLSNGDAADTERSLRDLHVPGVLFAFVHEALALGLERSAAERAKLSALLGALAKSGLLSEGALVAGVRSCVKVIADLAKDATPHARDLLCSLVAAGVAAGYLPPALADAVSADTQRLLDADKAGAHSADAALNSVRALTAELTAALAAGDAARLGALFAPNAVLLPAGNKGAAVAGREAIAAHLKALGGREAGVSVEGATSLSGALLSHGSVRLPGAGAHMTLWLPSRSSWTISRMIFNQ